MLEYDEAVEDEIEKNKDTQGNLAWNASLMLFALKIELKELGRERFLEINDLDDDKERHVFLRKMPHEERRFILDLFDRYPNMSDEKLGEKFVLEGEYHVW